MQFKAFMLIFRLPTIYSVYSGVYAVKQRMTKAYQLSNFVGFDLKESLHTDFQAFVCKILRCDHNCMVLCYHYIELVRFSIRDIRNDISGSNY